MADKRFAVMPSRMVLQGIKERLNAANKVSLHPSITHRIMRLMYAICMDIIGLDIIKA
jgi:hypothetical protein